MSLAHASDPSAGASRLVCEVPSCRRAEAPSLVRLRAPGRRFPESRWLCRHHHQEARDEGLTEESPVPTTCLVPNCATIVAARGLCQRHYQLARSRGLIQPGERGPAPASVVAELSAPLELETVGATRPPMVDLTRTTSADDDAPERAPSDVLQPETRGAFIEAGELIGGTATIGERSWKIVAGSQPQSPIDPLLQAYGERDLWQHREAAAVERARTAEQERDEARAESSSHLQFIDALLAAAGWKRGADDSDAAKIAHINQIITERASWKESWQRRAQELAAALGKKPEDASYRECLAIVREREDDRIVWNQRVTMMMEALPRHLFAGGERLDQMVVGVCRHLNELTALLTWADRTADPEPQVITNAGIKLYRLIMAEERADDAVRLVSATLDQLGAPTGDVPSIELEPGETRPMRPHERLKALLELDPDILAAIDVALSDNCAPEIDGDRVKTRADRVHALVGCWQDAIRSVLPGNAERSTGERTEPLAGLLRDIRNGLEKASEEGSVRGPLQQRVTVSTEAGPLIAIEWALDEVRAPQVTATGDRATLAERIHLLAARHREQEASDLADVTERAAAREGELLGHLSAIRQALNVGPPSASDVRPGTPWTEVARIVRARSELMLEERDQRVALGQLVERIAKSTGFAVGPLLGNYGPLEEHVRGLAKEAGHAARQEEWLAEHLADSTPALRALVADGCGFVEPLASLIAERAVPAGLGREVHEERLVVARLFAAHLLSDPLPF